MGVRVCVHVRLHVCMETTTKTQYKRTDRTGLPAIDNFKDLEQLLLTDNI